MVTSAPNRRKTLPELDRDVSATDNNQMVGDLVELHDRRRVEDFDLVEADDVGMAWTSARVDEDRFGFQEPLPTLHQAYLYRLRTGEPALTTDQLQVFGVLEPPLVAGTKELDDIALPPPHRGHVDLDGAGLHPVVGSAADQVSNTTTRDHRLRRQAADVHTNAADLVLLDDRRLPPRLGQIDRKRFPRLSRTNDDGVEALGLRLAHGITPLLTGSRTRSLRLTTPPG